MVVTINQKMRINNNQRRINQDTAYVIIGQNYKLYYSNVINKPIWNIGNLKKKIE